MTDRNATRIFVSCPPGKSDNLVQVLVERLKNAGLQVLLDKDEADAGSATERNIFRRIKSCTHFLPVLTESTLKRYSNSYDPLRRKLNCAIETRKKIIPVMLDGNKYLSKMPASLQQLQSGFSLELSRKNLDETANKLIEMLPASFVSPLPITSLPNHSLPHKRKNWLPYLLLLVVLAGALLFALSGGNENNVTITHVDSNDETVPSTVIIEKSDGSNIQQAVVSGNNAGSVQQAIVSGNGTVHQQSVVSSVKINGTVSGNIVNNSTVTQVQHGYYNGGGCDCGCGENECDCDDYTEPSWHDFDEPDVHSKNRALPDSCNTN